MPKTTTTAAQAAQMIREELKTLFPETRFCCKTKNDTVRISWVDGPTTQDVYKYVGRYQRGRFNSSIDMYENTNINKDIPQVTFVFCNREMSAQTKISLLNRAEERLRLGGYKQYLTAENMARSLFENYEIKPNSIIKVVQKKVGCDIYDMYAIECE